MWTPTTREQHNGKGTRYQSDLTDAEWRVIEPHLPEPRATGRPRSWAMREIVNGIFYVMRAEPRYFPRRYRANLAQTDVRHHALEAAAGHRTSSRTTEIVVDNLDIVPSKGMEPVTHSVLQQPALAVVGDLMG